MEKFSATRLWSWIRKPELILVHQDPPQVKQDYEQYQAYSQLLDRNGQWIGVADTKAGALLAFFVVVFPVFATPVFPAVQKVLKAVPSHGTIWDYLPAASLLALLSLFLFTALLTLFLVLRTLIPKLTRQEKPGLLFFGDIARQEYYQWRQRILTLDSSELASEVLEQVYATASIAHRKHLFVRRAMYALFVMILSGLALYISSQLMS